MLERAASVFPHGPKSNPHAECVFTFGASAPENQYAFLGVPGSPKHSFLGVFWFHRKMNTHAGPHRRGPASVLPTLVVKVIHTRGGDSAHRRAGAGARPGRMGARVGAGSRHRVGGVP